MMINITSDGHKQKVDPRFDPSDDDNCKNRCISANGYISFVALLLADSVDPSSKG